MEVNCNCRRKVTNLNLLKKGPLAKIAKQGALILLGILPILAGETTLALNLKNISSAQVNKIRTKYQHASSLQSPQDQQWVLSQFWKCDLFGVRTRLQMEKDIKLYIFKKLNATDRISPEIISNTGAHPIKSYQWSSQGLKGVSKPLIDVLRLSSDRKELISEMSTPEENSRGTKVESIPSLTQPKSKVVAYAICR